MEQSSIKRGTNSHYLYTEPNYTFDKDGNAYFKQTPLEDLCVVVDLSVEVTHKKHFTFQNQEGSVYTMSFIFNGGENKNGHVSFHGGTINGYGNRYLTTEAYGVTYQDIIDGKDTSEMFGINSIDISYNSFMVPEVVINFTDIRGAALFAPETENHYGKSNARSFFQSFFSVPYPRFKMMVKGFYGKPVTYDLTCSDFKASFDSKTGNFNAVARMVGYSFALLDDVTMSTIIAAPLSTYRGRDYWTEQVNNGRFILDDHEMITLDELVDSWNASRENLTKERNNSGYTNELNSLTRSKEETEKQLSLLRQFASHFYNGIKSCKVDNSTKDCAFCIDNVNNSFCVFSINETIILNEHLYDKLSSILVKVKDNKGNVNFENFENYNLNNTSYDCLVENERFENENLTLQVNKLSKCYLKDENGKNKTPRGVYLRMHKYSQTNLIEDLGKYKFSQNFLADIVDIGEKYKNNVYVYFFNGSEIINKIRKEDTKRGNELRVKQNTVNEHLTKEMVNALGFKPSVKNIMKILFAHLETLIYCIYEVSRGITAIQNKRTFKDLGLRMTDIVNNGKDEVYPFPSIYKISRKSEAEYEEKSWIGDVAPYEYAIEQHLVEGFLDGIINTKQSGAFSSSSNLDEWRQRTLTKVPYPICPSDLFIEQNPFQLGITKPNNNETYYKLIGTRIASVLGLNPCLYGDENEGYLFSYEKAGERDAQNFHYCHPILTQDLLTRISNGSFSKDLIYYLETEMFRIPNNADTTIDKGYFDVNFYNVTLKTQNNVCYVPLYLENENIDYENISYGEKTSNAVNIENKSEFFSILSSNNIVTEIKDLGIECDYDWQSPNFLGDLFLNKGVALLVPKWSYDALNEINTNANKYKFILSKTDENINDEKDIEDNTMFLHSIVGDSNLAISKDRYSYDAYSSCLFKGRAIGSQLQTGIGNKHDYPIYGEYVTSKLNRRDDTLFSIPGYKKDGIDYQVTLFSQKDYITESDIDIKALLFLGSFKWFDDGNVSQYLDVITNFKGKNGSFTILPYYILLSIGGLLKCKDKKDNLTDYAKYCPLIKTFICDDENERLDNIRESYKKLLINEFKKFVDEDYKIWDANLSLANIDITSKENSKLRYHYYKIIKTSVEDGYFMIFRDDSEYVQEMTKKFFELKVIVKGHNFITKNQHPIRHAKLSQKSTNSAYSKFVTFNSSDIFVAKEAVEEYLKGFIKKANELYNRQITSQIDNGMIGNDSIPQDFKINTYNYFKLLWDKWLCNSSKMEKDWCLEKYFGDKNEVGKIHFIDSFYNDIGDNIGINVEKFVNLILRCKYQPSMNYPLITFISSFLRDNNMILFNIQNFLGTIEEDNVSKIFKPIPFNQITNNDIKDGSDIVVLYQFEPSSTLNMEGWQSVRNDNFNITDDDELQPLAISSKIQGSKKIPAIGVAYGEQYQSYFHEIKVGMESPAVTEQSIQAMLQISDAHMAGSDSNGRKIVPVAQDMYTVYANNAYQCTVSMMGCAWIQPLMYFQLLNVPLFNGAYIIHKVMHHIEPGNMTTNFVGTRLSKFSTKIMDNYMFDTGLLLNREKTQGQVLTSEKLAVIDNNCEYQKYHVSDVTITSLIEALNKTVNNLATITAREVNYRNIGDGVLLNTDGTSKNDDATLFDIIVTTYRDYCTKIVWITNSDLPQTLPTHIYIEVGKNSKKLRIYEAKEVNKGNPIAFKDWENLNDKFLTTFKKVYGRVNNTDFTAIWSNFNKGEKDLLEKVNKKLESIKLIGCNNIKQEIIKEKERLDMVLDGFQWVGKGYLPEPNPEDAIYDYGKKTRDDYVADLVNEVTTHIKKDGDDGGDCARYVWKAMVRAGILSSNLEKPNSACAYYKFLEAWGFEKVFDGMRGEGYEAQAQNGDISVTAGLVNGPRKNDVYGHIQIYSKDNNKWYSDKALNSPDGYSKPRHFRVYRLPSEKQNA